MIYISYELLAFHTYYLYHISWNVFFSEFVEKVAVKRYHVVHLLYNLMVVELYKVIIFIHLLTSYDYVAMVNLHFLSVFFILYLPFNINF